MNINNFSANLWLLPSKILLLLNFSDGEILTLPICPPLHTILVVCMGWRLSPQPSKGPFWRELWDLPHGQELCASHKVSLVFMLFQKHTGQFHIRVNIVLLLVWLWSCFLFEWDLLVGTCLDHGNPALAIKGSLLFPTGMDPTQTVWSLFQVWAYWKAEEISFIQQTHSSSKIVCNILLLAIFTHYNMNILLHHNIQRKYDF